MSHFKVIVFPVDLVHPTSVVETIFRNSGDPALDTVPKDLLTTVHVNRRWCEVGSSLREA